MLYAQLARDFGWEAYKTVFRRYDDLSKKDKPKGKVEKEDMWIVTFSEVVKRNMCPLFDFWGWPIHSHVLEKVDSFPAYLANDETTCVFAKCRAEEISKKYNFQLSLSS